MCGICGVVNHQSTGPVDEALLAAMNQTLRHRGPDGDGYFVASPVGLAMRRLAIIDLATGDQPIGNEAGDIWVVFNGEIYNFPTIRQELIRRGHQFVTQTDTEVIVHAYEAYGDDCVHQFNGMFAFALWDGRRRRLLLARDRLGIKPLYYHHSPERFVFGSELKAVITHPGVPRELDLAALDQFLTLEYVPGPASIFRHVRKLPPGHRLILEDGRCRIEQYWNVTFQPITASAGDCAAQLADLIADAVRLRLIADVPLGAFLSGGIDSSTVVAFMSAVADQPVRTFSIGFEESSYNELPYARLVAEQFGARHHEEILAPDIGAMAVRLAAHLDEPLADFSIFPTYLVSEVARRQVKVVLSGDGGDELFAGYDSYVAQRLARYYDRGLPGPVRRRLLPWLLRQVPPQPVKKGPINKAKRFVEGAALPPLLQHTRWMIFLGPADKARLYRPELQHALATAGEDGPEQRLAGYFHEAAAADPLAQQQYVDVKSYLVDDILTKVDRMSMAVGLEARVPLLDHRIVQFALNLPPALKFDGRQTKILLRQVAAERLPPAILDKPKEGFSIPLKHWLRGPLRPLLTDLLGTTAVRQRGYFDAGCVADWVDAHLAGRANHSHRLWSLMLFELWLRQLAPAAQPTPAHEVAR